MVSLKVEEVASFIFVTSFWRWSWIWNVTLCSFVPAFRKNYFIRLSGWTNLLPSTFRTENTFTKYEESRLLRNLVYYIPNVTSSYRWTRRSWRKVYLYIKDVSLTERPRKTVSKTMQFLPLPFNGLQGMLRAQGKSNLHKPFVANHNAKKLKCRL
jgi:hypothetical protein